MGWLTKDPIEQGCKSDSLDVLTKAIGSDEKNFKKAVKYLKSNGHLNLLLKLLIAPQGREELLKTLMQLDGHDPKVQNEINRVGVDGVAPIHLYSVAPNGEIFIRLLANNGANLDLIDADGNTPLVVASNHGFTENVRMLLNNGARDVNLPDQKGWTPLHHACQLARPEIVSMLLDAGANVNPISKDGLMPIHVAISTYVYTQHSPTSPSGKPWNSRDALMCTQLLMNHGADMDYVCPLGYAAKDVIKPNNEKEGIKSL